MPNFSATLKAEITRLAAKEVRRGTSALKSASARYRREIAWLKREIKQTMKHVNFLVSQHAGEAPATVREGQQIRYSAKWLKKHRAKLDLTAQEYGKLAGVSGISIYLWENGKNKPRAKHLPVLAALRGLGKKEARIKLALT